LPYTYPSRGGIKLLTKLKERIELWLLSKVELACSLGLTPNKVSGIGMIFAVLSAVSYWQWETQPALLLLLASLFLLASGFCDALDGVLARRFGKVTMFGGFLDSLLDRYADALVFVGVILGGLCDAYWGFLAIIGTLMVSYCRARAEAAGVKMETVGLMERAERMLILVFAGFIALIWREALRWAVIILAVLTNLTVVQRTLHFKRESQKRA
jgi:archaetidylinositol phosphate synthase